jgi:hypothetical protein
MPLIKIDRDTALDNIYEIRSKIDFDNKEAMNLISKLVDYVIHCPELESQSNFPQIRVRRG